MIDSNKISVSGKQTKVGKSLTHYVKDSLAQTLKKYFDNFISGNILFSKDTFNFRCEINIHIDSAIFIQGNAGSNDAYGAFNVANEKIKKSMISNKFLLIIKEPPIKASGIEPIK